MRKRFPIIGLLIAIASCWTACKDDVSNTGQSVLDKGDAIIVLADTFPFASGIDSCEAIISQPDSFLLGVHWIPCSGVKWIPIECSGFHAAWPNGSRLNAVDSMQRV